MLELEVFIIVNEAGDYTTATSESDAHEAYAEDIGGIGPTRCVKITVKVPAPKTVEATVTIAPEDETVSVEA